MNWFDLTIIAILSISVVVSLFRGLIREVLSLLIWIGAFWLAWTFVDNGASWLQPYIELPSARHLIAFVALFLAALIVGGLINYLVGKMITKTGLGATDRFFGMFFGLGRGVLAVTLIILFLQATPLSQDPWWSESKLQPQFSKVANWLKEQMPEDWGDYFSFDAEKINEAMKNSGLSPEQIQQLLNTQQQNQQPETEQTNPPEQPEQDPNQ